MLLNKSVAIFLMGSTESYFAGRTKKLGIFSSYYLLGYREGFMIGRLSSFGDLVTRVARFLTLGSVVKLDFWVLAWSVRSLPILVWFVRAARISLFSNLSRKYSFICQNGLFFSARSVIFNINTIRFLGVDAAILLTKPTVTGQYQLNSIQSFGIPVVGLSYNFLNFSRYSYQFLCASEFSRLFVFFLRFFIYFLRG